MARAFDTSTDSFAGRVVAAKRSAIREIFDRANQRDDVIRLEIGEPSFPTPPHVIDGALRAARDGFTGYTPNGGYTSLRELLAARIERVDRYVPDLREIVVTPGAMNALYSLYLVLLDAGDEVLLPTPGFPNMDEMVSLLGGVPVFYSLRGENGFLPDPDEIEGLISPRTKAMFINSPGNPTGAVFPRALVTELTERAARHGVWLISDEVYDEMLLDAGDEHVSPRALDLGERVVSVYSFSKIYAMTGWRVGYCAAPPTLADLLRKVQEPLVSCPSAISQKAAEAALLGPQEIVAEMRRAYAGRRDRALEVAGELGLRVSDTRGTFYMLVDISAYGATPMEFTLRLLDEAGVAVAPGEVFGPGGDGWVRISLAVEPDLIAEGLRRIAAVVASGAPVG